MRNFYCLIYIVWPKLGVNTAKRQVRFALQGQFEVKYGPLLPKILADILKIEAIMPKITAGLFFPKCIVCRLIWMPYSNAVD
jgi:hypothetical protein